MDKKEPRMWVYYKFFVNLPKHIRDKILKDYEENKKEA